MGSIFTAILATPVESRLGLHLPRGLGRWPYVIVKRGIATDNIRHWQPAAATCDACAT